MNTIALSVNHAIPRDLLPFPTPLFHVLMSVIWNKKTKTLYVVDWIRSHPEKKMEECQVSILRNQQYLLQTTVYLPTAEVTYPLHVHIMEEWGVVWLGTTLSFQWKLGKNTEVEWISRYMVTRLQRQDLVLTIDRSGRFYLFAKDSTSIAAATTTAGLSFSKVGRILPTLANNNRLVALVKTYDQDMYHVQWEQYHGMKNLPDCLSFCVLSWKVKIESELGVVEEEEGWELLVPIHKHAVFQMDQPPLYIGSLLVANSDWFPDEESTSGILRQHPFLVPRFAIRNQSGTIPWMILGNVSGTSEDWKRLDRQRVVWYWSDVLVDHEQQAVWIYSCQKQWIDRSNSRAVYQTTVIYQSFQSTEERHYFPVLFHEQAFLGFTSCHHWVSRRPVPGFRLWLQGKETAESRFFSL